MGSLTFGGTRIERDPSIPGLEQVEVEDQVYRTQIEILYNQVLISAAITPLASVVLVKLMADVVEHRSVWGWLAATVILSCARLFTVYAYKRKTNESIQGARRWSQLQVGLTWCTGAVWGVAGWLFFAHDSIMHKAFLVVFLTMTVGASLAGYSVLRSAFLGMMVPILVPLMVGVTTDSQLYFGGNGVTIAVALAVYGFLMYLYSMRLREYTVAMLRFGIQRDALALIVANEKRDIEVLAGRLEEEVRVRKEAQRRAEFNALHDPLTGVANRELLMTTLGTAITKARRSDTQLAVLFVDLNSFKKINDTQGHHAGDKVLQGVAGALRGFLRDSDIVARVGGDEFVVVLDDLETADHAMSRINELRRLVSSVSIPGVEGFVSCSVGMALFPRDGLNAGALLACADGDMYRLKRSRPRVIATS